ncbi:Osmolarity sensor protein EnvZ [Marinibacterium anthonyi]|nr:Osmolarity sensor protein EnvZ [Marinibacterium anthonyi]
MSRLGLAGRLILFIALVMLLVQSMALVAYLVDRHRNFPGSHLTPGADQIEATVALFDGATPAERQLLLRALSGSDLRLRYETEPPEIPPHTEIPMPRLTEKLAGYSRVLADRNVQLSAPGYSPVQWLPGLQAVVSPARIRVSVDLSDGSWLAMQRRQSPGLTLGGMPLGMISALLATLLAAVAMIVVWWETRPLRRMAQAVKTFGRDLVPHEVPMPRAPDLKSLVVAFNDMQNRIACADRNRNDMLAALSHDVRTPLTRLTLRLRKLEPDLQAAAARDIGQIERVADAAFQLTQSELPGLIDVFDLREMLQALAAEADLVFVDKGPDLPALGYGNRQLLERAVANLIDNALKYGSRARVILIPGTESLTVAVEDDGPGIPVADRDRVLQPFQRGEVARTDTISGNGLGLALAGRIISRHGGQLELGSSPAGGLRAAFSLDAGRPCQEEEKAEECGSKCWSPCASKDPSG